MVLNGSKYLIVTLVSAGLLYFFWMGEDSPLDPKHISLDTHEEVLALEETLVGHYARKLAEEDKGPPTLLEKLKEMRVLLQNYKRNYQELKLQDLEDQDGLQLVTSISSPVLNGKKLQASSIENMPLKPGLGEKSSLVFIGYNMIGPENLGAIQILLLTEKEAQGKKDKTFQIKLLQTALLKDCEVHDLTVASQNNKNYLLIAGQTSAHEFETPSFLEVFELKDGVIQAQDSTRIDLPSHAATSVIYAHDQVIAATGDHQGGIVLIQNFQNIPKGTHALKDLSHEFYELQDTRDLAANSHSIYAISGGQATLWSKRLKGEGNLGQGVHLKSLEGGLIPEAKSTIEVTQGLAYIGLGDGGTKIINLNLMEQVGEIPQYYSEELDSTVSVTNAVYVHGKDLFTADGEGGSRLFTLKSPTTLQQVAHIRFGKKTSVNAINKFEDFITFATGLGGVKIVRHIK